MQTLYITLHQKSTNGWNVIKTLPSDSTQWDKIDNEWINELFQCCTDCIKVGNIMYTLDY